MCDAPVHKVNFLCILKVYYTVPCMKYVYRFMFRGTDLQNVIDVIYMHFSIIIFATRLAVSLFIIYVEFYSMLNDLFT